MPESCPSQVTGVFSLGASAPRTGLLRFASSRQASRPLPGLPSLAQHGKPPARRHRRRGAECWGLAVLPHATTPFSPSRSARSRASKPRTPPSIWASEVHNETRYRISVVELLDDGSLRDQPWRSDGVAETIKLLEYHMRDLPATPPPDQMFIGPPRPEGWLDLRPTTDPSFRITLKRAARAFVVPGPAQHIPFPGTKEITMSNTTCMADPRRRLAEPDGREVGRRPRQQPAEEVTSQLGPRRVVEALRVGGCHPNFSRVSGPDRILEEWAMRLLPLVPFSARRSVDRDTSGVG